MYSRDFEKFSSASSSSKKSKKHRKFPTKCSGSKDCPHCAIPAYGYTNVTMQCVVGTCVCPSAFYHIALDPGKPLYT
jgi:hypothetical protein